MRISAKTGDGLKNLEQILGGIIRSSRVYLEKVYPYSGAGKIQTIRAYGQLLSEEYTEQGIVQRPMCLQSRRKVYGIKTYHQWQY